MEVDVGRQHGKGQLLQDSFARLCRGLQAEKDSDGGVPSTTAA